jgi:hypothetical protein
MLRPVTRATLREILTSLVTFVRYDPRVEGWVEAHPPDWCVAAILDRGEYPNVRVLRGIASYPMLRLDGTVCQTAGYDDATGYLLAELPKGMVLRERATVHDAEAAAGRLLQLVSDFPFRSDTDRAAWLAYLLTPLARAVIAGPTPLFVVGANVRGSGKTLLADLAGLILTGRQLPAQTYPRSDEELEKILVSVARMGLPVLCFDNVRGSLGGACLDKWLTTRTPTGRILGSSELVPFDWQTVLVATANNAAVRGDTDRRTIYCTMETEHERPELRTGFDIPDLPTHIRRHRGELLADALTILQAHHQAGLPEGGGRAKGTFEAWASRVRDAVMFAGWPDCERDPDDEARATDSDSAELGALLAALLEQYQGATFTVGQILEDAYPREGDLFAARAIPLRDVLATMDGRRDRPTVQLVGKRLAQYRNRWLNNSTLNSVRDNATHRNVWRVVKRDNVDR